MTRPPPRSTLFPYPPLFRSPIAIRPPVVAQGLPPQPNIAAAPSEPQAAASARDPELRPQPQAPADDLFADVAENDRFEIPDRKSTRLNSSHANNSYAVFCLK